MSLQLEKSPKTAARDCTIDGWDDIALLLVKHLSRHHFRHTLPKPCVASPQTIPSMGNFAALTRQEEAAGLLDNPRTIGTRLGWEQRLNQVQVIVQGWYPQVASSSEGIK